jgi:putative acetyltransferase
MLVRSELPADLPDISRILAEAFRRPDSPLDPIPEVGLVEALRGSRAWIPQQSLVAVVDDEIVGYCLCSRAHVRGMPCLALGPIGVAVGWQRQGIGTALINGVIDVAVDMGESLIGLLGDYRYYARFGFVPSRTVEIVPPDSSWGDYFQVRILPAFEPVSGVFQYPAPFRALT